MNYKLSLFDWVELGKSIDIDIDLVRVPAISILLNANNSILTDIVDRIFNI
jgi:hypothetical protein